MRNFDRTDRLINSLTNYLDSNTNQKQEVINTLSNYRNKLNEGQISLISIRKILSITNDNILLEVKEIFSELYRKSI